MAIHYIQVYDLSKYTLKSFDSVGEIAIDSNASYQLKYNANGTVKTLSDTSSAQTFTNKTLTSPTLGGTVVGTYTLGGTPTLASQTGVPYLQDVTNVGGGKKIAYGSAALVTGAATIATGLATVTAFDVTTAGQPTGTGTASNQLVTVTSITTGSVVIGAYSVSSITGATVSASTSTGTFYWIAIGS